MNSTLYLLADWALQPLSLAFSLLVLIVTVGWFRLRRYKFEYSLMVLTLLILWVASSPGFANGWVYRLENARSNPAHCVKQQPQKVVIPGGGLDKYIESTSPYEILDRDSQLRVYRALDIATPESQFVLLGGGTHARTPAPFMQQMLLDRGIPSQRISMESVSRNTVENAQALKVLFPVSTTPAITLVTSALHVRRAAASFEAEGYTVCHVSSDSLYSPAVFPVSAMPYLSGLQKTTRAMHEQLGWWVYQAKGYVQQ